MQKNKPLRYLSLLVLFFGLCLFACCTLLLLPLYPLPDGSNAVYILDVREVLGDGWYRGSFKEKGYIDFAGFTTSIVSHTEQTFQHENKFVYITQQIISYDTNSAAQERYVEQLDFFTSDRDTALIDYKSFLLPSTSILTSDQYFFSCRETYQYGLRFESRCQGLFLYRNNILYIDLFSTRNYQVYLSASEITLLLLSIDQKFNTPS